MDPSSLSTVVFFFFITLLIFKLFKPKNEHQLNIPPGPWKLPIIGSILHLAIGGSLPHRNLKDLASKYGPLMHIQLGEISAVVVSSPQVAFEVMKTHDLAFASRPKFQASQQVFYKGSNIGGAPYGAYWRQMRKICTLELLSTNKVKSFRSIREDEVWKFVESIRSTPDHAVNLSREISSMTYKIVCRAGFGSIGREYEDTFKLLMQEIVCLAGGFNVADLFPSFKLLHILTGMNSKLRKLHGKVDRILDDIICQHRKKLRLKSTKNDQRSSPVVDVNNIGTGEEDLVDVLLKVAESEGLEIPITSENIKAVILDMFIAGTDTSSTVLEWVMSELIRNPSVMEKAQLELRQALKGKKVIFESDIQSMVYLKLVIKETLRLHPPVPLLVPRECRQQCSINGYDIPVKTQIMVNAWAVARDPQYWDNGECFCPERFENSSIQNVGNNYEYLPFGAGRRMCPGITFGLANVELPLAQMLYHFDWKLPNDMKARELDMSETFGVVCSKRDVLHLIATPYLS